MAAIVLGDGYMLYSQLGRLSSLRVPQERMLAVAPLCLKKEIEEELGADLGVSTKRLSFKHSSYQLLIRQSQPQASGYVNRI